MTPPIAFNDLNLSAQVFNDNQTKFLHGIEWFDGDVQARKLYSNLRDITRKMNTIYAHGKENIRFIDNVIARKVVDLSELGCESAYTYNLNSEKNVCITHGVLINKIYMCTLTSATHYKNWILKNTDRIQKYFTSSSNIGGDTLSQAIQATFNSPTDVRILKENEYFTTSPSNQRSTSSSSGCISSGSYSYEMA